MVYEIFLGLIIILSIIILLLIAERSKRKSKRILSERIFDNLSKTERKEICLLIIREEFDNYFFENIFDKLSTIEKRNICLEAIQNNRSLSLRKAMLIELFKINTSGDIS